jgi:uncharacterized damage-inducible protein DinB
MEGHRFSFLDRAPAQERRGIPGFHPSICPQMEGHWFPFLGRAAAQERGGILEGVSNKWLIMANRYTVDGMLQLAEWTAGARGILLDFAAALPPEDYTGEIEGLGWGSIRGTLIHTAECYDFWYAAVLGARPFESWRSEDYPDVATLRSRWDEVMRANLGFLREQGDEWLNTERVWRRRWNRDDLGEEIGRFTPAWVVLHTITHEFHHKGQIVFASHLLGHPPPETDM